MSASINDGGSAFPIPLDNRPGAYSAEPGMTLRDWFAGQALAAMSADLKRSEEYGAAMRSLAGKAYFVADAMLAARTPASGGEG